MRHPLRCVQSSRICSPNKAIWQELSSKSPSSAPWHPATTFPFAAPPRPKGNDPAMTNPERRSPSTRRSLVRFAAVLALWLPLAASAQISLATAVDLAEKSSPGVRTAVANLQRATATLQEARDAYIPNVQVGTSPGYAYGYPLGYPSLFNATSQSLVLSFSQPDYLRAAHSALSAANLNLKDAQQQVSLDVAVAYVELD